MLNWRLSLSQPSLLLIASGVLSCAGLIWQHLVSAHNLGTVELIEDDGLLAAVIRCNGDDFGSQDQVNSVCQALLLWLLLLRLFSIAVVVLSCGLLRRAVATAAVLLESNNVIAGDPNHGGEGRVDRADANQVLIKVDQQEALHYGVWVVVVVKELFPSTDQSHGAL